ncbi:pyridoxamine 5'-phosphate oxidase family protein [Celeribacter baekdonensis]|jgi:hypothetical protein|uniref:Pyridoxamine 5'-phosphate oxidase n=1 Tax=Celeribacter baekdonensis TaxID=875171 RepID=A0A2R4M3B8_9RHOB|nr:pyridoxamine 5'-phosphate oxidase family protein [Celeribacter baekdonensis]AVW91628.1 pyridoxamine 5'-phosphate oxidase [Celeribacter baekdonensis]|tara:strand:+ start:71078 stop:71641 length:564 start_codon:yes stop_codon:yes gene_type:complete
MSDQFPNISDEHRAFIEAQHMYFVGTAAPEGRVNVSPKGMDSLRVMGPNRIVWMNYTGSGNETAGHLPRADRMTIMWCSFEKKPLILRAYGTARAVHMTDPDWADMAALFTVEPHTRQFYDMTVDLVQSSCGFAVPFMTFDKDRPVLRQWGQTRGEDYIHDYWRRKNTQTIDGFDTDILRLNLGEDQ